MIIQAPATTMRPIRRVGAAVRSRNTRSLPTPSHSEGGSAPLPKPPPKDAVRAARRPRAGPRASEASIQKLAPAKPALEPRPRLASSCTDITTGPGDHHPPDQEGGRGRPIPEHQVVAHALDRAEH